MDFVKVTLVMMRPTSAIASEAFFPTDIMIKSFGMDRAAGMICEAMSNWVIEMSRNQKGLCPVQWAYGGVTLRGSKLASRLARYRAYGPTSARMFAPVPVNIFGSGDTTDEQGQEDQRA